MTCILGFQLCRPPRFVFKGFFQPSSKAQQRRASDFTSEVSSLGATIHRSDTVAFPPLVQKHHHQPHRALKFGPGVGQFWGEPFRLASNRRTLIALKYHPFRYAILCGSPLHPSCPTRRCMSQRTTPPTIHLHWNHGHRQEFRTARCPRHLRSPPPRSHGAPPHRPSCRCFGGPLTFLPNHSLFVASFLATEKYHHKKNERRADRNNES